MAMSTVKFACTSLAGTNKVGDLKKDADGYYTVVVGALNMHNSSGMYYEYERAKELLTESSQLMRRVKRGALRGEYGHPKMAPGMTNDQFANRVMSIYEENTCVQFKELWLDFENYKDEQGRTIIAIVAKIIPSGPNGHVLEKQLNNPGENVCFSIRSFTDDYYEGGKTVRVLRIIVTFDYVNEPGMSVAQKWNSPALESLIDTSFSRAEITNSFTSFGGTGQESGLTMGMEDVINMLGWDQKAVKASPAWAKWTDR